MVKLIINYYFNKRRTKMSGNGDEMLLAVEELILPATERTEIEAALRSAGMHNLGDLVSKENLLAKGIKETHASKVVSAMHHFGLWCPKPSCEC
jgi:hypothetical protein